MKVMAGTLKGRSFDTPDARGTRPLLSRLRTALFDTLGPRIQSARFLDLYGGSGAFCYEALSRGAERAVIVESAPEVVSLISRNAKRLGIEDRLEIVARNVQAALPALSRQGRRFDIIGVAPPYFQKLQEQTLELLARHPLCADRALVFVQHHKKETIRASYGALRQVKTKCYGSNAFAFYGIDTPHAGDG